MFWPTVLVIKYMYYSKKKHCTNPQKIWKSNIQKLLVGKHNVTKGFRSGSLPHVHPGTAEDSTSIHTHNRGMKAKLKWGSRTHGQGKEGKEHHSLLMPSLGTSGGTARPSWLWLCPCTQRHRVWLGHQWMHGSGSLRHSMEEEIMKFYF